MKYVIVSELVGEPGAVFHPKPGINIKALIDGGFIRVAQSDKNAAESATMKPKSNKGKVK